MNNNKCIGITPKQASLLADCLELPFTESVSNATVKRMDDIWSVMTSVALQNRDDDGYYSVDGYYPVVLSRKGWAILVSALDTIRHSRLIKKSVLKQARQVQQYLYKELT